MLIRPRKNTKSGLMLHKYLSEPTTPLYIVASTSFSFPSFSSLYEFHLLSYNHACWTFSVYQKHICLESMDPFLYIYLHSSKNTMSKLPSYTYLKWLRSKLTTYTHLIIYIHFYKFYQIIYTHLSYLHSLSSFQILFP